MKSFFVFFFTFLVAVCTAQRSFTVNWNTSKDCETTVSLDRREADDITKYQVDAINSDDPIKIIIAFRKGELKKIICTTEKGPKEITANRFNVTSEKTTIDLVIDKKKLALVDGIELLAYPFDLKLVYENEESCRLKLGRSDGIKENEQDLKSSYSNILTNVFYSAHSSNTIQLEDWLLQNKNAIIGLDCSLFASSQSVVYRKPGCKNKDPKQVRSLWVGDFVKIYLFNFNPYLYAVQIDDDQLDIDYSQQPVNPFQTPDSKDDTQVNSDNPKEVRPILEDYASAVSDMESFINFVKENRLPNSELLEENKNAIQKNLKQANLTEARLKSLISKMNPADKTKGNEVFMQAQRFGLTLATVKSLTYTIESTILPIQIKSFDKLVFTVTIKDKVGGKVIKKQDYTFFIKGGLKVDQSFGITLHKIVDKEYALKTTNGLDTIYAAYPDLDSIISINRVMKKQIIADDSRSQYAIGLSTLTHLYYRLGCVNIGPEIGLAIDVLPQQKIRYMLGGSIMFRDGRHRISLDAGYLFGKYSVLSNTQKINDILDGSDAMPNLVQKNAYSLYFGISYNIPLIPKDTQKTSAE